MRRPSFLSKSLALGLLAAVLTMFTVPSVAQGLRVPETIEQPAEAVVIQEPEGHEPQPSSAFIESLDGAAEHIQHVEPVVRDGKLYIDADVAFELSPELEEAAYKGVPLHFTAEVEITQNRWWWFDKSVVKTNRTCRLMYNALTRQWRVGVGELLIPESSLSDALMPLRQIRGWAVAEVAELETGEELSGRIRLRLNTSLLARPFQVDAINSRAWTLATPWKQFSFSVQREP